MLERRFARNSDPAKLYPLAAPPRPAHYAYGLAIDSRDRPVVAGFAKRLFAVARFLG